MRTLDIIFRGKPETICIDRDYGYEPDTNAHIVDWHFDGWTPEQHLSITDDEHDELHTQICEHLE